MTVAARGKRGIRVGHAVFLGSDGDRLALADGAQACDLEVNAEARILDAGGIALVNGAADLILNPQQPRLTRAASWTITVRWSNWCGANPAQPVALQIKLFGTWHWTTVPVPVQGLDPVPPCLGAGGSQLSVIGPLPAQ